MAMLGHTQWKYEWTWSMDRAEQLIRRKWDHNSLGQITAEPLLCRRPWNSRQTWTLPAFHCSWIIFFITCAKALLLLVLFLMKLRELWEWACKWRTICLTSSSSLSHCSVTSQGKVKNYFPDSFRITVDTSVNIHFGIFHGSPRDLRIWNASIDFWSLILASVDNCKWSG